MVRNRTPGGSAARHESASAGENARLTRMAKSRLFMCRLLLGGCTSVRDAVLSRAVREKSNRPPCETRVHRAGVAVGDDAFPNLESPSRAVRLATTRVSVSMDSGRIKI